MTWLIFSLVTVLYIQCDLKDNTVWRYDIQRNRIVVCQNYEEDNYTLFHEAYHWIRYTYLTEEEKEQRKQINSDKRYASKYARTDVEESFAETWRVYLQSKIRRYNKKVAFIRDITNKYLPTLTK